MSSTPKQRALVVTVVSAAESRSGGGQNMIRFCIMIDGDRCFESVQLCDADAFYILMGKGTVV